MLKEKKNFEQIAQITLPNYFKELSARLKNPLPMKLFSKEGLGETAIFSSITNHFGLKNYEDFPGCYVFSERGNIQYISVTKSISTRIRQHLKGTNHSPLAYQIAKNKLDMGLSRNLCMQNDRFLEEHRRAQELISTWDLAVIEIADPIERRLFEVYAALKLNTVYDSFESE
ncbi:endonuclease [Leptospira yasudae]|uniref:endonuclease n=1 Tax=Leptospira yasudae TaxID=2202201 RepID=UPI000E599A3C|nr:endonuclease [Leptospira yasudae]RHX90285.1 endonuclease [Leptospira yasudae]